MDKWYVVPGREGDATGQCFCEWAGVLRYRAGPATLSTHAGLRQTVKKIIFVIVHTIVNVRLRLVSLLPYTERHLRIFS